MCLRRAVIHLVCTTALVASGCTEFRPVSTDALDGIETVRVTLTDHRDVVVRRPVLVGDSLVGTNEETGARVALATARVARIEARHLPPAQNVAATGARAAAGTVVIGVGLTIAGVLFLFATGFR